jgi:hypothetical protein
MWDHTTDFDGDAPNPNETSPTLVIFLVFCSVGAIIGGYCLYYCKRMKNRKQPDTSVADYETLTASLSVKDKVEVDKEEFYKDEVE